ncbi:matrix metallopeptidase-21 [Salvelinus namaycush]|uniref:Matrix metallopeptidase-21 n=1 Tax=Salvelinus namaycush TaxID=8040 RepID=A0A8U0QD43_SALNM|nr:matrix metallopeptidase-21 [Salvelinus namaycush]
MLTLLQLINVLLLTSIGSTDAEKLFHSRDHSDLQISSSHQAEFITDKDTAELFLSRYGFIRPVNWEELQFEESTGISNDEDFPGEEDLSGIQEGDSSLSRAETDDDDDDEDSPNPTESQAFISALREFQMVSGLSVTGLFDDATKAAMNKPRCGVPDKETDDATDEVHNSTNSALGINTDTSHDRPHQHQIRMASLLSKRRQKRHVGKRAWGNMAFSKMVLKWRLIGEGYSSQLTIQDQRHIISLAFRMWSEVCPLEFVEDTSSPLEFVDISLGFGTGRHLGCNQKFDGTGREFAHAWFLGDIHFDDDEHFTAPNTGSGISLLKVAVHEIGHVLGLPHVYSTGSIMQPSYLPQESGFEINWMDRKAIQHLYGDCKGQFNTVSDPEGLMQSLEELDYLAALDDNGNLSEIGIIISELPLDAQMAKALLASCEFDCVNEAVTIAAMLSGM